MAPSAAASRSLAGTSTGCSQTRSTPGRLRTDHRAAILGDRKVEKLDKASLWINRYNGTVCGLGIDPGANRRLVGRGHVEQRVDTRREPIHPQMRNLGNLGDRNRALRPHTAPSA